MNGKHGVRPGKPQVAVVCHYFPHYRTATLLELAASDAAEFLFLGDTTDPQRAGIKGSAIEQHPRFRRLRAWRLPFGLFVQPGLILWALGRRVDTLVIGAVPHCLSYWIAPPLARLAGKRVVFWTHGWIQDERGLRNWLRKRFYRLANALLLYGHFGKALAMQRGFRPEQLHVVYNALDYEAQRAARESATPAELQATRRRLFGESTAPVLVSCGRLVAYRELGSVLEALALLRSRGRDFNLLLIGDGPERASLEDQARRLGVPVVFYGACYDERELSRLIMCADLTVSPGNVGLTAMQSLAYGTPVLTHDNPWEQAPESESLEPGVTGQLFQWRDVDDMADQIAAWFDREVDREEIRRRCVATIERFYNPAFQRQVIERLVEGLPADDLFWMKPRERLPARHGLEGA